jgi:proteasome assembly chaperone (PAC2) family protein
MIEEASRPGSPFLIVGWSPDGGEVGWRVLDYLNKHLSARELNEIEPLGFFSLGGVQVKNNIIHFPQSKFYFVEGKNLIFFKSSQPGSKGYEFLNRVLDVARRFNVQGVYTIGGLVSMMAHTEERRMTAVFNNPELKKSLAAYDLEMDLDYQGAPSMSGFLLWAARNRNIAAVSCWVNIPFYFAEGVDPKADKTVLSLLNRRFALNMDLRELDQAIEKQDEEMLRIRENNLEVDRYITKLERNWGLTQEEAGKLVQEISKFVT